MEKDNNHNLKDSIMEKISGTSPTPRMYFTVRNISMWVFAGMSMLAGGLAVSSIILRIASKARILPPIPTELMTDAKRFFTLVPMFWVIVFAIFATLTYLEIRNTKRGYRYTWMLILTMTLLASMILGIVLFGVGAAHALDRKIPERMPFVSKIEKLESRNWLNPEQGLLIGEVISIGDITMQVEDPSVRVWTVDISDVPVFVYENLKPDTHVGIIGYIDGEDFHACGVRILSESRTGFQRPAKARGQIGSVPEQTIERNFETIRNNICEVRTAPQY